MGEACCGGSAVEEHLYQQVIAAIRSIRYGSVHVVIHDARVVQIEKTERVRFEILPAKRTGVCSSALANSHL